MIKPCKNRYKMHFSSPPLTVQTDNLADTICYTQIVELVLKISQKNHFNLIEYLAAKIYDGIYQNFIDSKQKNISLKVVVN